MSSPVSALNMPSAFPQERPVLVARLILADESDSPVLYRLELNRPATQRLATSFTFFDGASGLRCGGRCSPGPQRFRVVGYEADRCGTITYDTLREESALVTDENADVDGHEAPHLVITDRSHAECGDRGGWDVEHVKGDEIRHFLGRPEAILTLQ
ncbi:MAG: hypothetical protein HYZ71_11070 [Deltaproteobacteria bacterium]|nr:hypothetical protein [Deltaproteobacteria bacterium]